MKPYINEKGIFMLLFLTSKARNHNQVGPLWRRGLEWRWWGEPRLPQRSSWSEQQQGDNWGSRRRNWSWWSKWSPCTALRTEWSSRHSRLSSLDSPVRPNKYWFLAGGHSGLLFEKQAAFFNQRVLFLGVGWNVDLHDCEIGDGIVVTTMILEKWFYMPPIIPLVFGFGVCTLHFTR